MQNPKPTRAEKSKKIEAALFSAAASVVGEVGYRKAMISAITARANVAQGTFYNYFPSRQSLFDRLLPEVGRGMLSFIKEETIGSNTGLEREERNFRAFFTYLKFHPEFYRVLFEAEVFAPKAFAEHMNMISKAYIRVLKRDLQTGALIVQNERDLEAIAQILLGARHYIAMTFVRRGAETTSLPEWIVNAYIAFLQAGIYRHRSQ